MTQSKKIILAVAGICSLSLFATLNLIRKDDAKRALDSQSDEVAPSNSKETELNADRKQVSTGGRPTNDRATNTDEMVPPAAKESSTNTASSESKAVSTISANPMDVSAAPANTTSTPAKKSNYPGIEQKQDRVMVREVRFKSGDGEDLITVTLTVNDDSGEVSGRVWVIAEYVQHGTTGVMYMPSHEDLNLTADGKPQNSNAGQTFSMRFNTEKKFSIKRPGFEGEELTAIRVGVWDKKTGKAHVAKMPIKHGNRKSALQRAKVDVE